MLETRNDNGSPLRQVPRENWEVEWDRRFGDFVSYEFNERHKNFIKNLLSAQKS